MHKKCMGDVANRPVPDGIGRFLMADWLNNVPPGMSENTASQNLPCFTNI